MRIAITGAAGLVGTALARAFDRGHDVFVLGHADLDISDSIAVSRTIGEIGPDVLLNCAVAGVDDCEKDPQLARRVNVSGPRALAAACEENRAAIVHFSTNYVFDGERSPDDPYRTTDAAHPVQVYGVTKLEGERAVMDACQRSFVIRTSWVYGKRKESFLSTAAPKLAAGQRVRAITDTWASTTFVEDLAARVLTIVEGNRYGLFQVVNDGACTYETFAEECARLVRAGPSLIDRVTEADMKRPARRPHSTPMICEPPMRHWKEALAAYVSGLRR